MSLAIVTFVSLCSKLVFSSGSVVDLLLNLRPFVVAQVGVYVGVEGLLALGLKISIHSLRARLHAPVMGS